MAEVKNSKGAFWEDCYLSTAVESLQSPTVPILGSKTLILGLKTPDKVASLDPMSPALLVRQINIRGNR